MPTAERLQQNLTSRYWAFAALSFLAFLMLIVRLYYLQIVSGEYFRDRSENNRTRIVYIPSPRGLMLDRNGAVLVGNRPSFNIDFVPEDSPDQVATLSSLAELVGGDVEELKDRVTHQNRRRRFEPKLVMRDIPRDIVGKISAHRFQLPGIIVNAIPTRFYPFGDFAAHIVGYIREITSEQLKNNSAAGYRPGDIIGQYGLETKWETYLRGERGRQAVLVNASGTKIGEDFFENEVPGHNLSLTIDRKVQQAADDALSGVRGAIVAMDPRNGDLLALSSSPRFDPNIFTREVPKDVWADIVTGEKHVLTNRATQGIYPPGSVFKIFVALAGLAEEVVGNDERVFCPGFMQLGSRAFRCHKHSGHGSVNLFDALTQSCDVYFYTIGQRLGVDRIHDYAEMFGFGEPTGIGLNDENSGLIPSTEWKAKAYKDPENKKWYPGETLPVAIGQGANAVTPIQVARALSAVVNGGKLLRPRIVRSVNAVDGRTLERHEDPEIQRTIELPERIFKQVREAMVGVVNDQHGTGHLAALPKDSGIIVGGKTGTAQSSSRNIIGANSEDHAWFAGYAPANAPELVVVAIIENAGHGGTIAAPLVKKVMEAYFNLGGLQGKGEETKVAED